MTATATAIAPRPVFCVIDHLYRDLDVADAVRAGRFTHAGITLDLGRDPDWRTSDLPEDPEWRIEWSKFYYGLDLAHAFGATGDLGYLEAWQRLVRSWLRQVPPHADRTDVTARRVLNWIYAWQRFSAAGGSLEPTLAQELLSNIAAQLWHVRTELTAERNHRTFELYALLIAVLALPTLELPADTVSFAIDELHANLLTDIRPDGVHREASTHYHHVALRTYLGVYENALRFGVALPGGYRDRLERACEFAMHCHRPDGAIPAFSDSDSGSYLDLLALAGRLFGRSDFTYVATAGRNGTPPATRNASFSAGGYQTQRSGWGDRGTVFEDERYLIFDCGPLGDGGHGHYDLLNIEIAAGGAPLIVDPGRYVYSEEPPNWRRWFKSTHAHNTVTVDGLDQTPYRKGAPRSPVAQGQLRQRLSRDGLDMLWAEARSPCYEVVHERRVLFAFDDYWLIEDRLRGTEPHRYDLRFHLTPAAWNQTVLTFEADRTIARPPGFTLVFLPACETSLEDGWVAPLYGQKVRAPIVNVRSTDASQAVFLTLVWPSPDMPELRLDRQGEWTTAEVIGDSHRDLLAWSTSGGARAERHTR